MRKGKAAAVQLFVGGRRPMPPEAMMQAGRQVEEFAPARDLMEWVRSTFLNPDSMLFNAEHAHLDHAEIGVLWTTVEYRKHGKYIAGSAEIPSVQGPLWTKRRMEWQLRQWFGVVPDFLIHLDAVYAAQSSDARFCSLVEHELLHCGQALDAFGQPRFSKETGLPVFTIVGHDVEEFVSIVRRYGAGAAAGETAALVAAAMQPAEVAEADLSAACGTCLR